jgi:hypothetical protein
LRGDKVSRSQLPQSLVFPGSWDSKEGSPPSCRHFLRAIAQPAEKLHMTRDDQGHEKRGQQTQGWAKQRRHRIRRRYTEAGRGHHHAENVDQADHIPQPIGAAPTNRVRCKATSTRRSTLSNYACRERTRVKIPSVPRVRRIRRTWGVGGWSVATRPETPAPSASASHPPSSANTGREEGATHTSCGHVQGPITIWGLHHEEPKEG